MGGRNKGVGRRRGGRGGRGGRREINETRTTEESFVGIEEGEKEK